MSDSTEQKDSNARYWFYGISILVAFAAIWGFSEASEAGSRTKMHSIVTQINNLQQAYCQENGTYASSFTELGADAILDRTYSYTLRADVATYLCTVYDCGHHESGGREQAGLVDQTGSITFIDYENVKKAGRVIWVPIDSLHTTIDIR